ASLAILVLWRARAARRPPDELRAAGVVFAGPVGLAAAVLRLPFFLSRFALRPAAALLPSRAGPAAAVLASRSSSGLAMVGGVVLASFATWLGGRQALRDAGRLVPPLHYGWFIALGLVGMIAAAAGVVWAVRAGILINTFELFAAAMAALLVIVLAL